MRHGFFNSPFPINCMQDKLSIDENTRKDPAKVININKKEMIKVVETPKKDPTLLPKEPEQYIKSRKHDFL